MQAPSDRWQLLAQEVARQLDVDELTINDLAARSGLSARRIRTLLHNQAAGGYYRRTLAAIADALGWPPGRVDAILAGELPAGAAAAGGS